jgi:hypothetical protein
MSARTAASACHLANHLSQVPAGAPSAAAAR